MRKIIFLDVDGVLNKLGSVEHGRTGVDPKIGFIGTEPELVSRLNTIVARTGAHVVLSSAWRKSKRLRKRLIEVGIKFVDITPSLGGIRGDEIKKWLEGHPKVKRYAILDDDTDMLEEQMGNFFHVQNAVGLTEETAQLVVKHLAGDTAPASKNCPECSFEPENGHGRTCSKFSEPKEPVQSDEDIIVYEKAGILTIKTRHEINLAKEELINLEREILNK